MHCNMVGETLIYCPRYSDLRVHSERPLSRPMNDLASCEGLSSPPVLGAAILSRFPAVSAGVGQSHAWNLLESR